MPAKYKYPIFDGEHETRKPCDGFVVIHRTQSTPDLYNMGFVLDYDQKPGLRVAHDAIYIINIKMKDQSNVNQS